MGLGDVYKRQAQNYEVGYSGFQDLPFAVVKGDVNLDGGVNFLDIAPFIGVLSAGSFQPQADINSDGGVTFLDISPFIGILSGSP